MKKENFAQWNSRMLKESSSKINIRILWIILIDALFYIASISAVLFWIGRVQQKLASFTLPQGGLNAGSYPQLLETLSSTKTFFYILILSLILLVLLVIMLASISRAIIWSTTTKSKISMHLISRFFLLNLIWMTAWILLIFAAAFFASESYAAAFIRALVILALYFSPILYSLFVKEPRMALIKKAISLGVLQLRRFALPFAGFLAVCYLIQLLSIKTAFFLSGYIYTVLFLAAAALLRYYFSTIVYSLNRKA